MEYVQRLRVEAAVGYVAPAFVGRLSKRLTDISPAVYRQQRQIPQPVRDPA